MPNPGSFMPPRDTQQTFLTATTRKALLPSSGGARMLLDTLYCRGQRTLQGKLSLVPGQEPWTQVSPMQTGWTSSQVECHQTLSLRFLEPREALGHSGTTYQFHILIRKCTWRRRGSMRDRREAGLEDLRC